MMLYRQAMKEVLDECYIALSKINEDDIYKFIDILLNADKVFFVGVGRVKLSLEAFAKRMFHLGIDSHIVGDINEPAMTNRDILVVGSGSGESLIPVTIANKAKKLGGKIIHIGSNTNSSLKDITDLMIRIPVRTKLYLKDEIESKQPMSSLFEQSILLFADIVAYLIIEKKNIDLKKLWNNHANLE